MSTISFFLFPILFLSSVAHSDSALVRLGSPSVFSRSVTNFVQAGSSSNSFVLPVVKRAVDSLAGVSSNAVRLLSSSVLMHKIVQLFLQNAQDANELKREAEHRENFGNDLFKRQKSYDQLRYEREQRIKELKEKILEAHSSVALNKDQPSEQEMREELYELLSEPFKPDLEQENGKSGVAALDLKPGIFERPIKAGNWNTPQGWVTPGTTRVSVASTEPIGDTPDVRDEADGVGKPEVPEEFKCKLTAQVMVDPVVAADGFSYERSEIARWIEQGREVVSSPVTGLSLTHLDLTPNLALRNLIRGSTTYRVMIPEVGRTLVFSKEQLERLRLITEDIQRLSEVTFYRIAVPTAKHWFREFGQQSCSESILKALAIPTYLGFLAIGFITAYSSFDLLFTGDPSQALSSDISKRVDYANGITNVAAFFACVTDLPAITYWFCIFVGRNSYREAVQERLDQSYHSCVDENPVLDRDMHEELYQQHISGIRSMGFERFYLNPDLLAPTGEVHAKLAPIINRIDREIKNGPSFCDLLRTGFDVFRQESCRVKLGKIATGTVFLGVIALSGFLLLENSILLVNTPVSDLFGGSYSEQYKEAFYLTQLGGLFSSITAFGTVMYASFYLFLQTPYRIAMCEKVNTCFAELSREELTEAMRHELDRIKEMKLTKLK